MVSDGFRANLIGRGVPAGQGAHDPQWRQRSAGSTRRLPPTRQLRARLGARPGDCLVLYAGTHGISHGLPGIADAAARLGGEPVHFAFVGEGSDKHRLQRRISELGLGNVTLLPGVPHAEVPALLAAADICLVPLRDVPLFSTFIPSKMFEYLAAGKAVVGAVTGEAAQILRGGGRGGRAAGGRRGARRGDPGARRLTPSGARLDGQAGPRPRGAVLRPRRAGPGVPQDHRDGRRPPMKAAGHRRQRLPRRLRAARGGAARTRGRGAGPQRCGGRARSPAAVPGRSPGTSTRPTGWPDVFAAARCDALVNLASLGFGHAPAIIAAAEQAGIGRAVFVSTTAVTTALPAPSKRMRLAAERADPLLAACSGRSSGPP